LGDLFKGRMLKNDDTVCTHGGFDCLDCKEALTEALAIAAMYEQIDGLVVPSICPENCPSVIGEAMASGIPVIASDIGGIRELVEPGVTGFLVPPGDSRAFANAIERLRADSSLRRVMGEQARRNIQQDDLRTQVTHMLAIFQGLDAGRGVERPCAVDILLADADHHWSAYLRQMMRTFAALEAQLSRQLVVCRMDRSDEASLDRGKLLLIASVGQAALSHALRAFERQIPIVACANVRELRGLCVAANAGLFYENLNEFQECLALLLSNEPIRQATGRNGWNFVRSLKRATARSSKSGVCRLGSLWKRRNGRTGPSRSVAVDTEGERPCTSASGGSWR
jgi:glycosyltransferase involved in cell wall biosynthesis